MDDWRIQTLAHDMKAPLGALSALLQMLPAHAGDGAALCRDAARMQAACAQLLDLAGQLACPQAGTGTCRPAQIAREAAALYGGRISLALEADCPAAADAHAVRSILQNLLSNAVKYTPAGGAVVVRSHADEADVYVIVEDAGIGMGEETMAHLFTPHARGQEAIAAGIPGTGLGLAAAREMARRMGGEITARSVPGAGSVFTLRLPLDKHADIG